MPVPTLVTDLSTTLASNSPAGSDNVFPDLDNYLRALSGFVASIRDNSGNGWVSPYLPLAGGTVTGATIFSSTVALNGALSGTGLTTYLASPPAIGGTAPAAGSFTTLSASGNVTLSGGTANGVLYLNGSKVATSGTAMIFDGTNLGIGISPAGKLDVYATGTTVGYVRTANQTLKLTADDSGNRVDLANVAGNPMSFTIGVTEGMRLTSTGLGIGTSSPGAKLDVYGGAAGTVTNVQVGNASTAFVLGVDGGNNCQIRTAQSVPIIFYTAATEKARITSGGDLLVGTTSTAFTGKVVTLQATSASNVLTAWNSATTGDNSFVGFFTDGGTGRGSIDYNRAGGLVRYNTTSDYRAKDIIGPVQNVGATIDALKVYEGVMKGATQSRPMLIAHEAQQHAPYAVSGVKDEVNEDGTPKFQQMDVSSLVPLLLAEIQSLRARVAALEAQP